MSRPFPLSILILAAGKGTRMRSSRPKVLHCLSGLPVLAHVIETARSLKPRDVLVLVGHQADEVKKYFRDEKIKWVLQKNQLGTAHAVLCGLDSLKSKGPLLILYGDVPLLTRQTLEGMVNVFQKDKKSPPALVLLTAHKDNPTGYGRIVRDELGNILRVVEEKEAEDWEKEIQEINAGIYLTLQSEMAPFLLRVKKSLLKGEYYFTDLVKELVNSGKNVSTVTVSSSEEVMGINTQADLSRADQLLQQRIQREWMEAGVTLIAPSTIRIEKEVELEPDVVLHPGVILSGKTKVSQGAEVLPYSVIEDSEIGEGSRIGPFAHLRPGSLVGPKAHVGNFVELKKTRLGRGSKANHLSYLGDATIGTGVNIGAGTITCNYDGIKKHRTLIGDGVFIGSDTQLVAPVKVGKGATVGAGSTVTQDIPARALAVSRTPQKNILGWAKKKGR